MARPIYQYTSLDPCIGGTSHWHRSIDTDTSRSCSVSSTRTSGQQFCLGNLIYHHLPHFFHVLLTKLPCTTRNSVIGISNSSSSMFECLAAEYSTIICIVLLGTCLRDRQELFNSISFMVPPPPFQRNRILTVS